MSTQQGEAESEAITFEIPEAQAEFHDWTSLIAERNALRQERDEAFRQRDAAQTRNAEDLLTIAGLETALDQVRHDRDNAWKQRNRLLVAGIGLLEENGSMRGCRELRKTCESLGWNGKFAEESNIPDDPEAMPGPGSGSGDAAAHS